MRSWKRISGSGASVTELSDEEARTMATRSDNDDAPEVVVAGSACLDVKGRPYGDLIAGTSNPGAVRISVGGCARNVAENMARLGMRTVLLSAVCQDDFGRTIVRQTERAGVNTD